jgi:hypothetical protein
MNHRGIQDTEREHRVRMKAPDVAEEEPLTGEIIGAAIEVRRFFKLTGLKRGVLINFKVERLVDGVKRVSL